MTTEYVSSAESPPASQTDRQDDVAVTMVTTPGDGSCGIGTYARDLLDGIDNLDAETVPIPQDDRSVRQFVELAVRTEVVGEIRDGQARHVPGDVPEHVAPHGRDHQDVTDGDEELDHRPARLIEELLVVV
jgi:hypothetical protein